MFTIPQRYFLLAFVLPLVGCSLAMDRLPASIEQTDLFISGQEGYHTFRIPSLLVTPGGAVLAFCEGRKNHGGDSGDIDLVMKRSLDSGRSWEPMRILFDDGPNTVGNPCPVVDRSTGTIWLLTTHNPGEDNESGILTGAARGTRSVWVSRSDDDGRTWTDQVDITAQVKPKGWTWYATGPGCGIQLRSGRLVIPCDHNVARDDNRYSHVIFSDDHGASWQLGGTVGPQFNECQVVERVDGALLLNMRNYDRSGTRDNRRGVAVSHDGGLSWPEVHHDPALIEPVCQASFIRLSTGPGRGQNRLLFANPASRKRERMAVRLSYDEGETWPVSRVLHEGPSAYSALAALPDQRIACLYECGKQRPYENIRFARFSVRWLIERNAFGVAPER